MLGPIRFRAHRGSLVLADQLPLLMKRFDSTDNEYAKFHYITIPAENGSVTMNVKCKEIYLANPHGSNTTGYEIFAELTQIPTGSMFTLTGAGIDG